MYRQSLHHVSIFDLDGEYGKYMEIENEEDHKIWLELPRVKLFVEAGT